MDLLVENGSQTTFRLPGNNLSALSTESQPNKGFLSYQRLQGNPEAKLEALKSLQKEFPTPTLNLFTALEEKRLLKIPEDLSAKTAARNQFFSGINLNEKGIKLMPNMYQVLYKYTTILPINNENYKANADVLLKGQNCDSENFIFYINWIFKNLEYYSQNNLNASFKYVFNKYLNDEKCIKANKTFYDQSVIKLNSLEAVPIGTVMPELEMQDFNNKTFTLSEIYAKSKYTFLMFFNPDCIHCQQQAPKVAEYFNTLKKNGVNIQTITFLNTDNQTDWRKFTDQYFKNGWLNLKSKDNNLDYLDQLQSYSNPNFFLLDQKGKVLLKSFSEQQINKLILENSVK
ncbi:redoxin domain-containing protein [Kaistella flava (ex Peng et al. 2021)]|uniref:Redoxin domain-containing protein n=1 Tax=Kaistella flava (ex Peng et al. 2021) TaxID=2038776 RepID=A0A7M2YC35_9FLAO|nr:redoxin domain-containing protein [Kaistella flava (ex Peng et al. 2021)]QOW11215.1 redoxin domain-containing protein [Kaistella flava (ex Peng et al. 2021)]